MGILKSIRRGIVKVFGGRLKEDMGLGFDDREEPDHRKYRQNAPKGFRAAHRDLRGNLQNEQNKQAYRFFMENPIIRRLSKMVAEFIIGNGIRVTSKDPQVQAEIDEWWNDPVNDFEKRHFQLAIELPLYGELIFERVVNAFTGRHRYNMLDPLFIANAVPHPKYPAIPAALDLWASGFAVGGGGTIRAKVLNGVPEEAILASRMSVEDDPLVFYFRTNNLSGALRGHSNYYPLFEWADVLDNAAFTMGERMVLLLMYVWHLKADNMDAETKKSWEKMLQEANPGSALITGKSVELTAITPDLKNADFTEGARFLRNFVAGCAGVPEHWMGEGGDVNRATAVAMDLPTLRSFIQQQREFVAMIRTLCKANLTSVAQAGRIPVTSVNDFQVQVDPMNPKDATSMSGAFNQLTAALANAKAQGWITDEDARQAIKNVLGGVVELEDQPEGGVPPEKQLPPEVVAASERVRKMLSEEPKNGNLHAAGVSDL